MTLFDSVADDEPANYFVCGACDDRPAAFRLTIADLANKVIDFDYLCVECYHTAKIHDAIHVPSPEKYQQVAVH